jgi:AcrR family transcriptional regulator
MKQLAAILGQLYWSKVYAARFTRSSVLVIIKTNTLMNSEYNTLTQTPSFEASSARGIKRSTHILNCAEQLLIEQGYQDFTVRKVATAAQVSIGNLQHYFQTKTDLTRALFDKITHEYREELLEAMSKAGEDPKKQLEQFVAFTTHDLNRKRTTHLFPEIWALSNHNEEVALMTDNMYEMTRSIVIEIASALNPALSNTQARLIALFITASLEGHTPFVGYKKKWHNNTADIIKIASKSFYQLIMEGAA